MMNIGAGDFKFCFPLSDSICYIYIYIYIYIYLFIYLGVTIRLH